MKVLIFSSLTAHLPIQWKFGCPWAVYNVIITIREEWDDIEAHYMCVEPLYTSFKRDTVKYYKIILITSDKSDVVG